MKILMLATEFPPARGFGLCRYAWELGVALATAGHSIHVLTCNQDAEQPTTKIAGMTVHAHAQSPIQHYNWIGNAVAWNLFLADKGIEILRQSGPFDLLLSHDWLAAHASDVLSRHGDIPWVLFMHDMEHGKRFGELSPESTYIDKMEAWACRLATTVICNSRFLKRSLIERFKLDAKQVEVIYPGVNAEAFRTKVNVADFRTMFVRKEESLLVYVGRLSPMKGIDELLEAFYLANQQRPELRLMICGDGVLQQTLQKRSKDLGISEAVLFSGTVSANVLSAIYRIADLVVVPSLYEPFGMVATEAAALGAPVLVKHIGGLMELAEQIPLVKVVDYQAPAELADHLVYSPRSFDENRPVPGAWRSWQAVVLQLAKVLAPLVKERPSSKMEVTHETP